jgi:hypothetical protein
LEMKGQGVVDEMGVLIIHAGYADHFFPGTSVLQTRPRYLFFVCWNFLWLARQKGISPKNIEKRKDEAELNVTERLVTTKKGNQSGTQGPNLDLIIGARLFEEDPPRVPAQPLDYIYWTALRKWGFYTGSRSTIDRSKLFRNWRGSVIRRVGELSLEDQDSNIREEPIATFLVPPIPDGWQQAPAGVLDFELTSPEARWLQDRLLALDEVATGPCLLAKAAEICADHPPNMSWDEDEPRPWEDPLIQMAASQAGQSDLLERARRASQLAYFVRSIYAALVEWVVELTSPHNSSSPIRHYRDLLGSLARDPIRREQVLGLSLDGLYLDVPKIPVHLRHVLTHVQIGLNRVAAGEDVETVFMGENCLRLFERVERYRKWNRARLSRTEEGAARRAGFGPNSIGVYDLDYRWKRVRYLLWDLHRGLARA